jgi:copper chaperone
VQPQIKPDNRLKFYRQNSTVKKIMALKLHVPTVSTPEAAKSLRDTILTSQPEAKVDIDIDTNMVTVESQASETTFKQLIVAAGHQITNV